MLRRSVLWNMAGQAATLVIGFVPSVLVARWLGPSERGVLAVITTASAVAFIVSSLGVPLAILYYASQKTARSGALLVNSLVAAGVLGALFVVPTWALRHRIASLMTSGHGAWAWVLAAVVVPVTFFDYATHNQLLGRLRFRYFNTVVIVSEVVSFAAVVVMLRIFDLGVSGVLVASLATSVVAIAGSLRVILPGARLVFDRALFRQMLAYGRKSQINSVFNFLNSRFDVLILRFFVPLSAVGYYVVAQFLAELVTVMTRSFQNSATTLVARDSDDLERQSITTATLLRHHGLLAFASIVANAGFAPLLIYFAYGDAYVKAILPFFIILPGVWFLGAGLLVANDLNGRNRPGTASKLSGLAAGVTMLLDFVLIPPFGVVGAAVASLVAYVVFGVASLVVESRVSGVALRELLPRAADAALYPAAAGRLLRRLAPG